MRSLIAAASLAGIALPVVIPAQTPPPSPAPLADGVPTRDGALARADRQFDAMDTDRDGRISTAGDPSQGDAGRGGGRMLEQADIDKDGIVTREEFRAAAGAMFDRQDANKDGRIDAAERQQWREQRMPRRGQQQAD